MEAGSIWPLWGQLSGTSRRQQVLSMIIRLTMLIFLVSLILPSIVKATSEFHVDVKSGRIEDSSGRERIFHGLNVVMKGSPWHPRIDSFDAQLSFADADIANLRGWGFTAVRLAVMWPGVEPHRGQVNHTYLAIMQSIVQKLHSAGIYTLLEFHQDLFSSQFCGEGVPAWVIKDTLFDSDFDKHLRKEKIGDGIPIGKRTHHDTTVGPASHPHGFASSFVLQQKNWAGKIIRDVWRVKDAIGGWLSSRSFLAKRNEYLPSFPEPLNTRWPLDLDKERSRGQPSTEQCSKHTWFWYYFSYAVSRAFQDLYENRWGWADLLARYWQIVAMAFRDQPGVLGYELMNEPWAGDFFHNPLLMLPGVADRLNLAPFYEKLQSAVRSVDPDSILFIETVTFEDVRCGFSTIPGGAQFQNRTVLSYHYYRPPNLSPRQAFTERLRESKRLGCGAMLTEFFVANKNDKRNRNARSFDSKEICNVKLTSAFSDKVEPCKKHYKVLRRRGEDRDSVDEVLAAADAHVQSWIGWEYKAFFNKTGSMVDQSLFNSDGHVNLVLAQKLARTYPHAVLGRIVSFSFHPPTSAFSLVYIAANRQEADQTAVKEETCTEVFVHRPFYYPSGLDIKVDRDCILVRETEKTIFFSHSQACVGLTIDVRISKRLQSS